MKNKMKDIIIIVEFIAIILVIVVVNLIKKDEKISITERRKLTQFPKITLTSVLNGTVSNTFEKYATDQFMERDTFRKIKYLFNTNVLMQQDNNNMFIYEDSIYKMEYPLNEEIVEKSASKINEVYQKYLKGMNVYYTIIPDKNYYLNDNHLKLDYSKLEKIMKAKLNNMKYIDIKDSINKDCFYKTDLHWKQESIVSVADLIKKEMNLSKLDNNYIEKTAGNFYGVYYGQVGISLNPDVIKYLTNEEIENCTTFNYETQLEGKVYDIEKYNTSSDKYDIFLSGATPLISIDNPNTNTEKELLIFRDSFGSSLAPFMIENYKKITLIDLRYINSNLLGKYIDFKDQDVLFIYSGIVLNQNTDLF